MKKKLSILLLAFVVAVTSFTSIDLVNNKAEAKDWVKKGQIWSTHYHSGSFKNYTYSPTFHIYYPGRGTYQHDIKWIRQRENYSNSATKDK